MFVLPFYNKRMYVKLLELETSNLIHGFVWAMPSRRTNNFLGHVTPTIFGSTVGYPSDSLASRFRMCDGVDYKRNANSACSY